MKLPGATQRFSSRIAGDLRKPPQRADHRKGFDLPLCDAPSIAETGELALWLSESAVGGRVPQRPTDSRSTCLLYTSDAADDASSV